jgi:hypothetical protein
MQPSSSAGDGIRRRYAEDDSFFNDGDMARYSKFEAYDESLHVEQRNEEIHESSSIECTYRGCNKTFKSLSDLQKHYYIHSLQCLSCGKIMPNSRLLEIHVTEEHSSYFKAKAEKVASYICIIDGCGQFFWTQMERNEHLSSDHMMASNIHLSSCFEGTRVHQRSKNESSNKKQSCRFIATEKGCRYGAKCKFSHLVSVEPIGNETDTVDSLLSELNILSLQEINGQTDACIKNSTRRKTKVQL